MILDSYGNPIVREATQRSSGSRGTGWMGANQKLGDSASVASASAISLSSAGTVELWIYPFSANPTGITFPVILSKGNINTAYQIVIDNTDHVFGEIYVGASSKKATDTGTVSRSAWTHYAMRWNGTNVQLVKNGAQVASTAAGNCDTNSNPLHVGDGSTAKSNTFGGLIYDLRIWNAYRDDTKINANKSVQVASNASGLVANWMFDEGIGLTAADRTANALNLTLLNSDQWSNSIARPY